MTLNRTIAALCALAFLTVANVAAEPQEPSIELGEVLPDLPSPTVTAASTNDAFASAVTVSSFSFFTSGNNGADTTQAGEPLNCGSVLMGHTVWYRVVPSATGTLYADTWGSTVDTVLAGYQGTTLATLVQKACNDDDPNSGGTDSAIEFPVLAGTTYYIQLGGYETDSGAFELYIDNIDACTSNDNQASACAIPSVPFFDSANTAGATTELAEPPAVQCPGTPPISHTVWYTYTVPTGLIPILTASTAGSNYDTVVDVFVAQAGRALVPVACNDDSGGSSTSQVSWNGVPGLTYYIRVSGYSTAYGSLSFSLS